MRAYLIAGVVVALAGFVSPPAAPEKPDRPRVTAVSPADAAKDVDPVTEIRVRFDRPMNRTDTSLSWAPLGAAGFRLRGEVRYVEATHEFIFPVHLTPGVKHEITVNLDGKLPGGEKDYQGFRSDNQVAAKPYSWSFATAKPAERAGTPPRVTAIQPPPDSQVAQLTLLEVTFDRPMDPLGYGLTVPGLTTLERRPELQGPPDYDADHHRFTLMVRLPPNWNGELRLQGFRGADGVPAEPRGVKYRTLRTVISDALQKRVEQAGRSAELRKIVESALKARRELKSVSEEVVQSTLVSYGVLLDCSQTIASSGARFEMQGRQKFLGVIDDIMRTPFRVGSDGDVCWFRMGHERIVLPAKDVTEKNVLIADAFDAFSSADADAVIRDMKLEYAGESTVRGRRCHRVRCWTLGPGPSRFPRAPREWCIDAETLLPLRLDAGGLAFVRIEFTHTRINGPIPDTEFRPDSDLGVRAGSSQALSEEYTTRFLNAIDGSTGRMSVRWGEKGPRAMRSSGLN
jgi:hypothetical protein